MSPASILDYTQPVELLVHLRGQPIRYLSKPGLPDWRAVSPAAALLAEHAALPSGGRALWLGCGHGAAAAALALRFPTAKLLLMDHSCIALQMCAQTLRLNQVENAAILDQISCLPEHQSALDAVLIDLPKGRRLVQRWLAEAWFALRPGGSLFLAGAKDQGVQPAIRDASQLFGLPAVLDYAKGNRVVRWVKSSAENLPTASEPGPALCAWLASPGVAPGTWQRLEIPSPRGRLALFSLPGVFSSDQLDEGTALLLDHLLVEPGRRVLDLGCGYGVIGILAAQSGAARVDLLDNSLLAVACAQENLTANHLSNARALPSDGLSAVPDQRYDLILSNPPFHAGKGVDYHMAHAFIEQSWRALETPGALQLVANRFIRYEQVLQKYFSRVSVLAETSRYRILSGIK